LSASTGSTMSSSRTTYLRSTTTEADGNSGDFAPDSSLEDGTEGAGPPDAPTQIDVTPAPAGLAGFAFVVNGVIQVPMTCPSDDWEFPPTAGTDANGACTGGQPSQPLSFDSGPPPPPVVDAAPSFPPCPGVAGALLINTGEVPIAYLAAAYWSLPSSYRPGVLTGNPEQVAGVLPPGGQVDITSVYSGGITALLGSSDPFSFSDSAYASDEGTVPWPGGVSGSNGSTQMWIAEIEVRGTCGTATQLW
jgi:hypothetical protein